MEFSFNERKAAQAAAWLLQRRGGAMGDVQLVKLLYLADRRALCDAAHPITGDRFVAMPFGLILEGVFDRLRRSEHAPSSPWGTLLRCGSDRDVRHCEPICRDELSDYEIEVLDAIHAEFGAMNLHELGKRMFKLPEWTDPEGGAVPIDPKGILRSAGYTQEDIDAINEQLNAVRALVDVLG